MDIGSDTIKLRKNMFVCHNEREEYLQQAKMKKMKCDRKKISLDVSAGFDPDNPSNSPIGGLPAFKALTNVDILESIAIYLPMEDILGCRLVCKLWSVEMTSFLCKRKSLIIVEDERREAEALLKKRLKDGNPVALSKLSLFNVEAGCSIFSKIFSVFGCTLSNVSLEDCKLSPSDFNRMLLVDAPSISSLHLREGQKLGRRKGSTFQLMKSSNSNQLVLPKLKRLHWDEEQGRTELKELVETCPNLVSLELRNFPVPRSREFRNLRWRSLTHLFLSPKTCLTEEHCKALGYLGLKLEKLTLFGINTNDDRSIKALNKFLSTLADSLEILELWLDYATLLSEPRRGNYSPLPVSLPKVKRLQTECEIIGHINHLSHFPALRELEIVSNTFEDQNWNSLTKRTLLQRHSLLQVFRCGDIDSQSLRKVMKAFPSITSLQLDATYVSDAFLRAVIKNLTALEDFTISPCIKGSPLRVSDSGITGIPSDFCKKFNRNPEKFQDIDISAVKTHSGIGDLKLLQKLDFSLQTSDISDASLLLSITTLTKLSSLKLPLCQINDISLKAIERRLNYLILLGVAGCKNLSQEAIDNLKTRRPSLLVDSDMIPMLENLIRK